MAIVPMKHLRLIAVSEEQDALLDELQQVGCVQISTPEVSKGDPDWAGLLSRKSSTLGEVSAELASLQNALSALNKYDPVKEGMLAPRPTATMEALYSEETTADALQAAEKIGNALSEISSSAAEESKLQTLRSGYLPWKGLDLPLETTGTRYTELILGVIPSSAPLDPIHLELQEKAPLSELVSVSAEKGQQYVMLLCHKEEFSAAMDVLKSRAFSQVRFKGVTGTAAENLRGVDKKLDEARNRKADAEAAITALGDKRFAIKLTIDRLTQDAQREGDRERLVCTDRTFFLEGWYSAPDEQALTRVLEQHTCAWESEDPAEEEYSKVPVKLKNGKLVAPLNMVTEMYSLPAYGSLDPNPLMAPFFVLFYGIMMADMGYGLLMILMWYLICKVKKAKGTMGNLGGLLGLCGVSTFIMGALTGGFFGDFLPQIAKLIDPNTTFTELPHLFTAQEDTIMILIGSLILGFVQCVTGMAINAYKKFRDGDPLSAVFGEIAWWVLYACVAGFLLAGKTVGLILLAIGLVMLLAGQIRANNGNVIGALGGLFGDLYNGVSGIFSDVLSYSRLMALMLSGAIIASVFNTLGAVPGNVVVFIIISMFGNILNFALNILGCYVHDLRLQVLEFFSKFYVDGGKPFRPLSINTKYVDIIKEEN